MYRQDRVAVRPLRQVAACVLLAIGTIGIVLPLIPGIPFLIAGALLLPRADAIGWRRAIRHAGLTMSERVQVQLLLIARRITMAAEALRRARRARQRNW